MKVVFESRLTLEMTEKFADSLWMPDGCTDLRKAPHALRFLCIDYQANKHIYNTFQKELKLEVDDQEMERFKSGKKKGYNMRQMIHIMLRSFQSASHKTAMFESSEIWNIPWQGDLQWQLETFLRIFWDVLKNLRPGALGGADSADDQKRDALWKQMIKTKDPILLMDVAKYRHQMGFSIDMLSLIHI